MKKHLFSLFTAILLSLTCLIPVLATETETTQPVVREPGFCGENIRWSYDDGILTIDGEGLMDDFEEGTAPWYEYRKEIREVVFTGGVTYVGAWSFTDFDKLETVDFGNSMYELGKYSFRSCDGLTVLHLPDTFKVFGEESLRNCKNLKEIHCTGRPLSFRLNSLWDTYATIYFPADRPWGVDYIAELEAAFHGRIQFIASDGTDPYDPDASTGSTETTEEPTEEPTEETTEETVPETTAAPEEPTEATEATTPPPTPPAEIPTQSPSTAPTQTQSDPLPQPQEPEEPGSRSWIALIIIAVVAAFLLIGTGITMLTGSRRSRGRYSK